MYTNLGRLTSLIFRYLQISTYNAHQQFVVYMIKEGAMDFEKE